MKTKSVLVPILSILCVSLFPCFFLFFHNVGTATINDLVRISSVISIASLILFALNYFILRNIGKAALFTNLIMGIFLYFGYIEKTVERLLPMLYYWHVALICLFLIIQIGILIYKKMPTKIAGQLNNGLLYIFAGLILFNGILTIPKVIETVSRSSSGNHTSTTTQMNSQASVENKKLPNVYYFIFDEYAGINSIKRYCNYDNSGFYDSLEQLGFTTSKNSVNETIDTYTEIPNLLQLRKVNTVDMTANEKKENLKNPYLLIFMRENGYSINALDSSNYQFIDASQTDSRLAEGFSSTYGTFNSYIIKNTILYPLYGREDHEKEIVEMNNMFDYGMESSKKAESNQFTVGYFSFPHVPFIVDENGKKTDDTDRLNLRDPNIYLGQFKYASKKIIEMLSEIIENDPNSVIILQSDHGYRLPSHLKFWYGISEYDLTVESPYERNILDAVYYKGEKLEINDLSGLDTLKLVLNKLLDTDLK